MNWENSKALTPLKREFLRPFFAQTEKFFLTGGSALGIFYLDHRRSYDLDFFTTDTESMAWHVLTNQLLGIAAGIGAQCRNLIASPEFQRFELTRGAEREILDFVIERVPQVDPQKASFDTIRVDTLREMIANKLCTLVGRTEVKDLIDLYFLWKQGHDILAHLPDAQRKEGGLDPAMISYLLAEVHVSAIPEYVLQPLSVAELNTFIRQLQQEFANRSFPSTTN